MNLEEEIDGLKRSVRAEREKVDGLERQLLVLQKKMDFYERYVHRHESVENIPIKISGV